MPLSRHVETKTQSPSSDVGYVPFVSSCLSCGGGRLVPRFVPRLALRPVSACLPRMSLGPHRLIRLSSHPLFPCPSHPLPTGSAACLIRSPLSSSHRFAPYLVSPGSPYYRQAGRGENAILIGGRTSAADGGRWAVSWLLACLGWRREVIGGGWRRAGCLLVLGRFALGCVAVSSAADGVGVGVAACLSWGGGDGWDGSVISSSHLIGSSNRLRFSPGSSHRLGSWIIPSTGSWLLFHFSLTPSRLLFSACLPWLVPPSPAGGCAGCGMACGGGRAGCLHAFSSPVPLSRCRSFAHCYTPRVARAVVPARGVVGHFMGYFCRLLVGVGVFKYMPLNRILWLLTGIFGDSVRCHFSALPVASSSLICSVSCHLSAAASWRWCGCFPAVSW